MPLLTAPITAFVRPLTLRFYKVGDRAFAYEQLSGDLLVRTSGDEP